jgi:hypothetical protein
MYYTSIYENVEQEKYSMSKPRPECGTTPKMSISMEKIMVKRWSVR